MYKSKKKIKRNINNKKQNKTRKRAIQKHDVDVQMTIGERALISTSFPTFANTILSKAVQFRDSILSDIHGLTIQIDKKGHLGKKKMYYVYEIGRLLGLFPIPIEKSLCVSFEHYASLQNRELLIQLVHTPKCGGRFLKAHLRRFQLPLPKKYQIFPKSIRVHSPAFNCTLVFINGHLPARNFTQNALMIGTIREPYARMASAYSYLRDGAHSWEDWDVKTKKQLKQFSTISLFLKNTKIRRKIMSLKYGKKHFFSQTYWLCDHQKQCLIDLPLFQDNLNEDINRLCTFFGLPLVDHTVQHINVTKNKIILDATDKHEIDTKWWTNDNKLYQYIKMKKENFVQQFENKCHHYVSIMNQSTS